MAHVSYRKLITNNQAVQSGYLRQLARLCTPWQGGSGKGLVSLGDVTVSWQMVGRAWQAASSRDRRRGVEGYSLVS